MSRQVGSDYKAFWSIIFFLYVLFNIGLGIFMAYVLDLI